MTNTTNKHKEHAQMIVYELTKKYPVAPWHFLALHNLIYEAFVLGEGYGLATSLKTEAGSQERLEYVAYVMEQHEAIKEARAEYVKIVAAPAPGHKRIPIHDIYNRVRTWLTGYTEKHRRQKS